MFTREEEPIPAPEEIVTSHIVNVQLTEEIIFRQINELNVNKSVGPDDIHPRLLKECAEVDIKILKIIFQKSFDEGVLPDEWKYANVTPIYKSGSRCRAENYRPVSGTSIICRVMERIIRNNIMDYLENN